MKKEKLIMFMAILVVAGSAVLTSCKKNGGDESVQSVDNVKKFHEFLINDQKVIIKEDSGKYYLADDIILVPEQFAMLKRLANKDLSTLERSTITKEASRLWTNATVYYTLNLGSDNTYAQTAMKNISNAAPIKFVQRTNQKNYVDFVKSTTGNNSQLGMVGGRQVINLYNSNNSGVITQEILHALAINHEQCRPDRGNTIKILLENIPDDKEYNFNVNSTYQGFGSFDLGSIMMYDAYAFSSNGKPTITKLDGSTYTSQISKLSQGDINGLNQLY